ncbi:hypothetical protein VTJ04DRAFT_3612 [Mycothermus thermophilus]|uniref:uncharacterized protein n=1 Tax=Humicola insolens TaxID=85995 RepID=UPI00374214F2
MNYKAHSIPNGLLCTNNTFLTNIRTNDISTTFRQQSTPINQPTTHTKCASVAAVHTSRSPISLHDHGLTSDLAAQDATTLLA